MRRSAAYRQLHHLLEGPKPPLPTEVWSQGERTYLVFDLISDDPVGTVPSLAIFVVTQSPLDLRLVRVVSLGQAAAEAHITELYQEAKGGNGGYGSFPAPARQPNVEEPSLPPGYLSRRH